MRDKDPLFSWLIYTDFLNGEPQDWTKGQAELSVALDRLGKYLQSESEAKNKLQAIGFGRWRTGPLASKDLPRAQEYYLQLVEKGGSGKSYVEEELLNVIAWTQDEASVPFWQQVLAFNRLRDNFGNRRREMALAALALLAINRKSPAAYAALGAAARHENESVRTFAAYYLGCAYLQAKRKLPKDVVAQLSEIAIYDKAFFPRFQARDTLRAAGLPVPRDNEQGAYAFKVRLKYDKSAYRVIELTADQTLEDLHLAIQQAFKWDNDHLYSFFLNNKRYDQRYAFDSTWSEDAERRADEGVIGELGLERKRKFLYFFDYGDSHEFEVEVVGITQQAAAANYPRVIESKGKALKQYNWDDDDWDEEEAEDEDDE